MEVERLGIKPATSDTLVTETKTNTEMILFNRTYTETEM